MAEDKHPSTHPPLPPTTEDDRVSWLRLLRSRRVGPSTFYRLMAEHGSAGPRSTRCPKWPAPPGSRITPPARRDGRGEMRAARARRGHACSASGAGLSRALAEIADRAPHPLGGGRHFGAGASGWSRSWARATPLRSAPAWPRPWRRAGRGGVSSSRAWRAGSTRQRIWPRRKPAPSVMAGGVDVIYPAENARLGEEITKAGAAPVGTAHRASRRRRGTSRPQPDHQRGWRARSSWSRRRRNPAR